MFRSGQKAFLSLRPLSILLGSKALGSTALVLMNPAGGLSDGINSLLESQDFLVDSKTYFVIGNSPIQESLSPLEDDGYYGFEFEYKF